jgi:hypothetical protein
MNQAQMAQYLEEVVNPRITQLKNIVEVMQRYDQYNEMSAILAMHEIAVILEMRNA